jgi:hypothetical protein
MTNGGKSPVIRTVTVSPAMDQMFAMNMQKPMFGDASGLTDTMWDLIVDALGTLAISVYGWRYMNRGRRTIVERLIQRFIDGNPGLFDSRIE